MRAAPRLRLRQPAHCSTDCLEGLVGSVERGVACILVEVLDVVIYWLSDGLEVSFDLLIFLPEGVADSLRITLLGLKELRIEVGDGFGVISLNCLSVGYSLIGLPPCLLDCFSQNQLLPLLPTSAPQRRGVAPL